jgi:radical SAM superfamily enzyme YgiQ (UPF0313 family)
MKVALIYTPARPSVQNYFPPLGLMYLAAFLEKGGHEVAIIDNAKTRDIAWAIAECEKFQPDLIGVGGIITAYQHVLPLVNELKEKFPNLPVVIGGQVVTDNDHNLFKHCKVDYTIHGYGEIPLLMLCDAIQSGDIPSIERIPGLTFRQDGNTLVHNKQRAFVEHMDDLPLPAYHLIDMEYYSSVSATHSKVRNFLRLNNREGELDSFNELKAFVVMVSRGCSDKCTFCVHEQEFVGLKRNGIDYIRNHLRFLRDNYDIRFFSLGEEMVITNTKTTKHLVDLMNNEFADCYWQTATRANFITKENVDILKGSNCISMGFGYESGSQKILDLYWKRTTREDNINAYRLLHQSGINPGGSLMVGMVGEDFDSIADTCDSLRQAEDSSPGVFFCTPYPGSRLYDWAIEKGLITDPHKFLLRCADFEPIQNMAINMTNYRDWVVRLFHFRINGEVALEMFRQGIFPVRALKTRYGLIRLAGIASIPLFAFLKRFEKPLSLLLHKPRSRRHHWTVDKEGALAVADIKAGTIGIRVDISRLKSIERGEQRVSGI